MRNKLFYLFDASLITLALGLLTLPGSAFSDSLERQKHLKEAQTWENDAGSSNKTLIKWVQNQGLVQENQAAESIQILPVAVAFQTTEYSQPNFTEPTDPVDGIFLKVLIRPLAKVHFFNAKSIH